MMKLSIIASMALIAVWAGLSGGGVARAVGCTFTNTGTTMTLDGNCTTEATILIPNGYTLDGAGYTITAVDPAIGHFVGAIVGNDGPTADVKNLTVTTSALANLCDGGSARLRGIMFEGASGSIINNTVANINQGPSGCQEGNAIEIRNAPFDGTHPNTQTVLVANNTVTSYQKTGILANGDVDVDILNNTITGLGEVPFIAQNGIQVGFGATGNVKKNTVVSNVYTGSGWVSTGMLVFQSDEVMVQDNAISASQTGIAVETWCWNGPASASYNRIIRNTIEDATWGVTVAAYDLFSACDPSANNNKVSNNSITSVGGDVGVFVLAYSYGFGFTPTAENNKVIRNKIIGYATDVDELGASGGKIHANVSNP